MAGQYWWSDKAWGEKTIDLLHHFGVVDTTWAGNVEIMMGSCGTPGDITSLRYQAHDPDLAPPAEFLVAAQSSLGDHFYNSSAGTNSYKPEEIVSVGASPTYLERWKHNFSVAHYAEDGPLEGVTAFTGLGSFHSRYRTLMRYADWNSDEVRYILGEFHGVLVKEGECGLCTGDDGWQHLVDSLPGISPLMHLTPLMRNHNLPVGEAADIYREVASYIIRKFEGSVLREKDSIAALGLLAQNPNTPTDLLVRAYEVLTAASEWKLRLPAYEGELTGCVASFRTHPNFPDREEVDESTWASASDDTLIAKFDSRGTPGMLAICKEMLTNPAREAVLRSFASDLLGSGDGYRMSLLLPAVGAILEEASASLADDEAEVPFEWLLEMVSG